VPKAFQAAAHHDHAAFEHLCQANLRHEAVVVVGSVCGGDGAPGRRRRLIAGTLAFTAKVPFCVSCGAMLMVIPAEGCGKLPKVDRKETAGSESEG